MYSQKEDQMRQLHTPTEVAKNLDLIQKGEFTLKMTQHLRASGRVDHAAVQLVLCGLRTAVKNEPLTYQSVPIAGGPIGITSLPITGKEMNLDNAKRLRGYGVNPAYFYGPGWTPESYLYLWAQFLIEARNHKSGGTPYIYLNEGWYLSSGCVMELGIALENGFLAEAGHWGAVSLAEGTKAELYNLLNHVQAGHIIRQKLNADSSVPAHEDFLDVFGKLFANLLET